MGRVLAVVFAVWALVAVLPIGAWTGVTNGAYYGAAWSLWARGLGLIVLVTALLAVLGGAALAAALRRCLGRIMDVPTGRFLAVVGVLAAAEAGLMAVVGFGRMPPVIDAWVQYFQARVLLSGSWVAPPATSPAHFGVLFAPITASGWFGQYPPIHPGLLALGMAAGVPWLVTPLLAAALPAAVYALAATHGDARVGRLAAALVLLSPFVVAMDASAMNHLPAALVITLGLAVLPPVGDGRPWAGLVLGASVGLALGLRPLDAIVLAVVAAPTVLAAVRTRSGAATVGAAAGAGLVTLLPTLVYNRVTTGSVATFTYSLVQGTLLGLDQDVPWGTTLTLGRALGLTAIDAHQMNVYLFEWPVPVTLLAAFGCWRAPRVTRVAGTYVLTLVALLFFYFHRDTLFGPRLFFSAVPAFLVLVAAGLMALAELRRPLAATRLAAGDLALVATSVMVALATVTLAPARLASYRTVGTPTALHPEEDARRDGIANALVLIPDGLGSRLIVRLWERGVPMTRSTHVYRRADACRLTDALGDLTPGADFEARLDVALAGATPGRRVAGASPDPMLRLPDDGRISARCAAELARDRRGTLQFAPYLYLDAPGLDGPLVWARELGDEDVALARRYPDRPVYRYRGPQRDGASAFVLLAERGADFAGDATDVVAAAGQLPK
jgi:hypothetical protein